MDEELKGVMIYDEKNKIDSNENIGVELWQFISEISGH